MRFCKLKACLYFSLCVVVAFLLLAVSSLYGNASATLYPEEQQQQKHEIQSKLGGSLEGLLWFVQVTDIHLSIFRDSERISEFEKFCFWLQSVVRPPVVVASGDLTDAKTSDHFGSRQWLQEWKFYQSSLQSCLGEGGSSKWLDIRGNHDTFDVIDDGSENNFYIKFSVQGPTHNRSYMSKVNFNNRTFGFVGIDATLVPGPKRPFNFFGALDHNQYEHVKYLIENVNRETDHHIVFGHYPTSCILAPYPGIRPLLKNAKAYLCGHLHTLGGIVPEMYTRQKDGYFELELGDWKDNRRFRVLAIDQGQIAFSDNSFKSLVEQPVIVITNPVDIRFSSQPNSVDAIKASTHIRILIFSSSNIENVTATIDGSDVNRCRRVSTNQPLFVVEWTPSKYNDNQVHNIKVEVKLAGGVVHTKTNQFGLTRKDALVDRGNVSGDFSFLARLVLMTNLLTLTQACFSLAMLTLVVPLCLLRLRHKLTLDGLLTKPRRPMEGSWRIKFWMHNVEKRFWLIAAFDQLFYPLLIAPLYLLVGPWAVGFFLNQSFGILFAWGFYVQGSLLHADVTSFYAVFFMAPYLYLFTFAISGVVLARFESDGITSGKQTFCSYCLSHLWFFILMCFQVLHWIDNYFCYGFIASLGVCGFSRLVYFYFVWNRAMSLTPQDCDKLRLVWPKCL